MSQYYDIAVQIVLTILVLSGFWSAVVYPISKQMNARSKNKKRRLAINNVKGTKDTQKKKWIVQIWIERLLETSLGVTSEFGVTSFYLLLFGAFGSSFSILIYLGRTPREALLVAIVMITIIFLILAYIRREKQVKTSYQGKAFVEELLNNYRILDKDIHEALDATADTLKQTKYKNMQEIASKLSYSLQSVRNKREIDEVFVRLRLQLQTSWGDLLSSILKRGVVDGDDIEQALKDISKDLGELELINEKERQGNIEGVLLMQIFIPITLLGTYYLMYKWFSFTPQQIIDNQFKNELGFRTFFYMSVSIIATTFVFLYFRRSKNDF